MVPSGVTYISFTSSTTTGTTGSGFGAVTFLTGVAFLIAFGFEGAFFLATFLTGFFAAFLTVFFFAVFFGADFFLATVLAFGFGLALTTFFFEGDFFLATFLPLFPADFLETGLLFLAGFAAFFFAFFLVAMAFNLKFGMINSYGDNKITNSTIPKVFVLIKSPIYYYTFKKGAG
ncbi:MAG TPA: hypothetical protein PKC72_06995 [Chitinophagaceae bacterium]|nr:hypothetical protein [Chitinophagaceae bacterium]